MTPRISVIIPVLNEEKAIGRVLADIPHGLINEVIVVDNGSTDGTVDVAQKGGARVVLEPRRGYGSACLKGLAEVGDSDVLVFLDGDYSDHPGDLPLLLQPILDGRADLVIGSRVLGSRERGALLPQAIFGNWLATRLIRLFFGVIYTDLGPFRAVTKRSLETLKMSDVGFGWTVEMQVKAATMGLRVAEVPVSYRKRTGKSKITGTLRGTIAAGCKILWTIAKHAWSRKRALPG